VWDNVYEEELLALVAQDQSSAPRQALEVLELNPKP
jgi:hypothetical protein